jgi:hypothetical protein
MINLQNYFFDVHEQDVVLLNDKPWDDDPIDNYKAIVAQINGTEKVVSVAKKSYKLVTNQELIEPLLEQIDRLNVQWKVDRSHSFCLANRMRLQITFPEIMVTDDDSQIPLSVYLHNSYDQSEGVRLFWGAIRSICSNGMILGSVLGSQYARHTSGFSFEKFNEQFAGVTEKITHVQNRIDSLRSASVEEELMHQVQKALGKRRLEEIVQTDNLPDISQWDLLNDITYFISHKEPKPQRARLQLATSKVFAL